MEDTKEIPLNEILKKLVQSFFKMVRDITRLAGAEARLAAKSLVNIVILWMFIRALLFIAWVSFCGAIACYVFNLLHNWAIALLVVSGVNLILLGLAGWLVIQQKKHLYFSATRRQLHSTQIEPTDKELYNEYFTEEDKLSGIESNQ